MEIKTEEWKSEIKNGTLRDWIEKLLLLNDEAKIVIDEDGLYAKEVDPAHVCMVETTLHREAFERYDDLKDTDIVGDIGVNLKKLDKQLSKFDKTDILGLSVKVDQAVYEDDLEEELSGMTDKEYLVRVVTEEKYDTVANSELLKEKVDELGIDFEAYDEEDSEEDRIRHLIDVLPIQALKEVRDYVIESGKISEREVEFLDRRDDPNQDHHLVIKGEYRRRKMPLLDTAGFTEPNIPSLDLPNSFTIKTSIFSKIVGNSGDVSDHITIEMGEGEAGDEQLYIHTIEEEDVLEATIPKRDLEEFVCEEGVRSIFALDYLSSIMKPRDNGGDLEIQMGTDYPLDMRVDSEDMDVRYLLAPRIKGNEG